MQSRKRVVLGCAFIATIVTTTAAVAAAVTSDTTPSTVKSDQVTINAPSLDDDLRLRQFSQTANAEVDLVSVGPLVIASTASGKVDGTQTPYTLDVLDGRSSLEEIVKLDSLEPLTDSAYWAVFSDPRGSATEIVGDVNGVLYSLVVSEELTAARAASLVSDLQVEGSK